MTEIRTIFDRMTRLVSIQLSIDEFIGINEKATSSSEISTNDIAASLEADSPDKETAMSVKR